MKAKRNLGNGLEQLFALGKAGGAYGLSIDQIIVSMT